MRTDQLLLPLRSRYIYDQAATIYATIADGDDFPGDAIFDFFVGHEKFFSSPTKKRFCTR
jgi:hypothetical protein